MAARARRVRHPSVDLTDPEFVEAVAVVMLLRLSVRERDEHDQRRLDTVIRWLRENTNGARWPAVAPSYVLAVTVAVIPRFRGRSARFERGGDRCARNDGRRICARSRVVWALLCDARSSSRIPLAFGTAPVVGWSPSNQKTEGPQL